MKFKLKATSIYEDGQRKDALGNPHQEDYIFPSESNLSDDARLFILCDGMGGHDAGEVASKAVCDAMSRSILCDGHNQEGVFTTEDFENAIDAAFRELDLKDTGAEKKMGTTLAFLKLYDKGAYIAHMGDSRVYHIRPGETRDDTEILHVTPDHSLINDLLKAEAITKEEARTSKQKNVITRAMQPGMDRRPKAEVYQTSDIKVGDYFYLCSDGMLEDPEMEDGSLIRNIFSEKMGDIAKKTQILKNVTKDNRDNHSAFLIQITEVTESTPTVGFSAQLEDGPAKEPASDVSDPGAAAMPMAVPTAVKPEETASPERTKQLNQESATASADKLKKKLTSLKVMIGGGIGIIVLLIGVVGYLAYSSGKETTDSVPHTQPVIKEKKNTPKEVKVDEPKKATIEQPIDKPAPAPAENQAAKPKETKENQVKPDSQAPRNQSQEAKTEAPAASPAPSSEKAEKAKEALSNMKKEGAGSTEGIVESDQNLKNDSTKKK
ncbi:MAG: protein phosphatase 2C domain-containing protein [Muribaculaceae bacterium]|nr:protein phosphatase 2C domain-containing protein [Muribaculaceae bacterium]